MDTVGERIRTIRKELKYTQTGFADELGISQTHVSKIEKNIENASSTLVRLIAYKFNYREEWILSGEEPKQSVWSYETKTDMMAKYDAVRVSFENLLRNRSGSELSKTIDAFSLLESILSSRNLDDEGQCLYLEQISLFMDEFEKLMFNVSGSSRMFPSRNDTKSWMKFKNDCNQRLYSASSHIKNAANIYLSRIGEEMLL